MEDANFTARWIIDKDEMLLRAWDKYTEKVRVPDMIQIHDLPDTRLDAQWIAFVNCSVRLIRHQVNIHFFLLKLTYHVYDLVQCDTKHHRHVVLNRKDWSTGLAVSKQVLGELLVVIAIYRKDIL